MLASQKKAKKTTIVSKGRILIVDDERDIVAVYGTALTRDGFTVEAYSNPEKALLDFKHDQYDLVILDIRMPKMNGFELCREIRKRDEKVKIYFMTAFEIYKTEFEKVLPSIKIDGFITKPLTMTNLCSIAQTAVGKSNSRDKA
jgi:two-component system catabolic regulation response regulator CreB/two-component system response regulator ChvI